MTNESQSVFRNLVFAAPGKQTVDFTLFFVFFNFWRQGRKKDRQTEVRRGRSGETEKRERILSRPHTQTWGLIL